MTATHLRATPYHRLSRGPWWRPLAAALAATLGALIAAVLVSLTLFLLPSTAPAHLPLAVTFAAVAAGLPLTLAAVATIERRPPGTLFSVAAAIRWRWLGRCLLAASVVLVALVGIASLTGALTLERGPLRLSPPYVVGMATIMLPLVILQSAAEELLSRGVWLQATGRLLRKGGWIAAVLPQAVLFASLHGFAAVGWVGLVVIGVILGLLTIHTGGLEAAISVHIVNNTFGVLTVLVLGIVPDLTDSAVRAGWVQMAVQIGALLVYSGIVALMAPRRPVTDGPAAVAAAAA